TSPGAPDRATSTSPRPTSSRPRPSSGASGRRRSCSGAAARPLDLQPSLAQLGTTAEFELTSADGGSRSSASTCFSRSQKILDYAETLGYGALFEDAGIERIDPSCGPCSRPGAGCRKDHVTVSATHPTSPGVRALATSTWPRPTSSWPRPFSGASRTPTPSP